MKLGHLLPVGAALAALVLGCSQHSEERIVVAPGEGADSFEDRTGKVWDLTFARDEVGMSSAFFTGGGGIGSFPIVTDAKMLHEGDEGYPADDDDFLLIGVDMNGSARAYSISSLTGVEVVNEHFGDDYVAVAY